MPDQRSPGPSKFGALPDGAAEKRRKAIAAALRTRFPPEPPQPVVSLPAAGESLGSARSCHNVFLAGRRTSLCLEAAGWEALILVAAREGRTVSGLLSDLEPLRAAEGCRITELARCYPLLYLRRLAGV